MHLRRSPGAEVPVVGRRPPGHLRAHLLQPRAVGDGRQAYRADHRQGDAARRSPDQNPGTQQRQQQGFTRQPTGNSHRCTRY